MGSADTHRSLLVLELAGFCFGHSKMGNQAPLESRSLTAQCGSQIDRTNHVLKAVEFICKREFRVTSSAV